MSSIESDTATSCRSSETAETSPATDVYCSRRPSSAGVTARKREQDGFGWKVYGQHSKAKLQKLQEKVKVHQQYVEETTKCNTTLSPTATSTAGNSMFPAPAMQNDPGLAVDFFMTPPKHFIPDSAPFRTRVPDEDTFLNPLQSPETYAYAPPFSSWNTLPGAYDAQEPLTPGPSCFAPDILTGFTMEDPFCSTQNLQGLHADNETQPQLSPEHARVAQGDSGAHADRPGSSQGRVRYVMEQAAAVGFETLDEAVAAYYTETFEDMPALYQEQRLSRNRRLPRLLNTLQSAAKGWSEWERRGFQEQITMGAEELLVQELKTFITQQRLGADGNKSANSHMGKARTGSADNAMMRSQQVQNDLPNLWALTTALLARANPSRQENGLDTVLGIIEALCHGQGVGPVGDRS